MVKEEVRVLVVDFLPSDLTLFIILRGVKGVEHVGLVGGSLEELVSYLRSERLLDEVRYMVLPDDRVLEVRNGKLATTSLSEGDIGFITCLVSEGRRVARLIEKELKPLIEQQ